MGIAAIDEIIDDLNRIPRDITSYIDIRKLTEEISKNLQSQGNRGFSSL